MVISRQRDHGKCKNTEKSSSGQASDSIEHLTWEDAEKEAEKRKMTEESDN